MQLLIDQGNSTLKWCFVDNDKLSPSHIGQAADLMESISSQQRGISEVFISSVKSEQKINSICELVGEKDASISIKIALSGSEYQQLKNGYKISTQLGVDRWLAMIAVWLRLQSGFILIDAGSALTLDVVDMSGQHLGGHIIPGLSMQKKLLLADTDRVNFGNQQEALVFEPGCSTATAVHNGCISSLVSYIDAMYRCHSNSDYLPLILTGGDALTLSKGLQCKHQLIADLVLQGLYYNFHS